MNEDNINAKELNDAMISYFYENVPDIKDNWENIKTMFTDVKVPPKTILLREGEIANCLYFINQGCLRLWFNDDGRDITFQFFSNNKKFLPLKVFTIKNQVYLF